MESECPTLPANRPPQPWFLQFISQHPFGVIIGFLGAIASILALLLGFLPPINSPKPKLSYCVYPIRTPLVQSAKPSDVKVTYKGTFVRGNMTAVQVAIWNAGREAIRTNDILTPIRLFTGNCPILELNVVKLSRDVIAFAVTLTNAPRLPTTNTAIIVNPDMTVAEKGALVLRELGWTLQPSVAALSWTILEHNDGALLQIVYAGTLDAPITLEGTIVGQDSPHKVTAKNAIRSFPYLRHCITLAFLLILAGATLAGLDLYHDVLSWDGRPHINNRYIRLFRLGKWLVVVGCVLGGFLLGATMFQTTPFGF